MLNILYYDLIILNLKRSICTNPPYTPKNLLFVIAFEFSKLLIKNCVTVTAVNILRTIPTSIVIAKPLIEPVPKKKSTTPAIAVVMFESMIVVIARWKPASIAARSVFPARKSKEKE